MTGTSRILIMGLLDFILAPFRSSKPKASLVVEEGHLKVKSYNKAFVEDLRSKMGDLTLDKSDAEVIEIYVGHEVAEKEEPKLEVLHLGLHSDGRVKMTLDWNPAFIKQCRRLGFEGETEELLVNMYLNSLVGKSDDGVDPEVTEEIFEQIDETTRREMEEARIQAGLEPSVGKKRRRYRTGRAKVVQ